MSTGKDKRIKRATRLNLVADHILGPVLRKQGKLFQIIVKNWSHIAGIAADWALPLAVHFPDGTKGSTSTNNDSMAVLSIGTPSARAPELQMLSNEIIDRANKHVGYLAFGRIRINQSIHGGNSSQKTNNTAKETPSGSQYPSPPAWDIGPEEKAELETMINTIKDEHLRLRLMDMLTTRLSGTKTP